MTKESLGIFGRNERKHCCTGWPVRSYRLCLEEMDEKVQGSSWIKTQLIRNPLVNLENAGNRLQGK